MKKYIILSVISLFLLVPNSVVKAETTEKVSCKYDVFIDAKWHFYYTAVVYNDESVSLKIGDKNIPDVQMDGQDAYEILDSNEQYAGEYRIRSFTKKDFLNKVKEKKSRCPKIMMNTLAQSGQDYTTIFIGEVTDSNYIQAELIEERVDGKVVNKDSNDEPKLINSCEMVNESNESIFHGNLNVKFELYDNKSKKICIKDANSNDYYRCQSFANNLGNSTFSISGKTSGKDDNKKWNVNVQINTENLDIMFKNLIDNPQNSNDVIACPNDVYLIAENFYDGIYNLSTNNSVTNSSVKLVLEQTNPSNDKTDSYIDIDNCKVLPDSIKEYIMDALKIIRWVALVLMVILGTLDFIKASAADDQDALKKASQSFIKRLIAVIILFLLPLLVEFILYIAGLSGLTKCYDITQY